MARLTRMPWCTTAVGLSTTFPPLRWFKPISSSCARRRCPCTSCLGRGCLAGTCGSTSGRSRTELPSSFLFSAGGGGYEHGCGEHELEKVRRGVGEPVLGKGRHEAIGHEEQGQSPLHAAGPEVGGHEQEQQDRRADRHPEQSMFLIRGQPVAVDGQAVERAVR